MKYCVVLRPLMGSNYVREETDAFEMEIKRHFRISASWCFVVFQFLFVLFIAFFCMRFGLRCVEWIWQREGCAVLFERMRGLPNDCCMLDRALCCFEKQREVPHANSKEILRKGDPRRNTMHSVSFSTCYGRRRIQELGCIALEKGPLLCHCMTNISDDVEM